MVPRELKLVAWIVLACFLLALVSAVSFQKGWSPTSGIAPLVLTIVLVFLITAILQHLGSRSRAASTVSPTLASLDPKVIAKYLDEGMLHGLFVDRWSATDLRRLAQYQSHFAPMLRHYRSEQAISFWNLARGTRGHPEVVLASTPAFGPLQIYLYGLESRIEPTARRIQPPLPLFVVPGEAWPSSMDRELLSRMATA